MNLGKIHLVIAATGLVVGAIWWERTSRDKGVEEKAAEKEEKQVADWSWAMRELSPEDIGALKDAAVGPELAEVLLRRARTEIVVIQDRAMVAAVILQMLAKQGYVEEAWRLVDESPGLVRDLQIGSLFIEDKVSPMARLLERWRGLELESERRQAVNGLVLSRAEELLEVDFRDIPIRSETERGWLGSGLGMACNQRPELAEALLVKAAGLLKDAKLGVAHFGNTLRMDETNDPFYQWKVVSGLRDEVPKRGLESLFAVVAGRMVRADEERAMDLICSDRMTKDSGTVIRAAVGAILTGENLEEAYGRLEERLKVENGARGQIVTAVATRSMELGDFETAKRWGEKIENKIARLRMLESIEAAGNEVL